MILYSRTLEVSEGRAVPQRLFSLGPCPLQASKHAPPARVRELAPTTGIAQGGPALDEGRGRQEHGGRTPLGVALSIENDVLQSQTFTASHRFPPRSQWGGRMQGRR